MADTKISGLAAVTSLLSTDELVLARSSTTKKLDAAFLPGFEYDYAQITSNVTISATTQAGANTIVSGAGVAYDGSTKICVEGFIASVELSNNVSGNTFLWNLWGGSGGSVDLGILAQIGAGTNSTERYGPLSFRVYLTPSAATHTFILKGWRTNANCSITTTSAYFPTFIRVTKA